MTVHAQELQDIASPESAARDVGGTRRRTKKDPLQGRALRRRVQGREAWSGSDKGRRLASALGWFSVGLGAAEILVPRGLARLLGLQPSAATSAVLRTMGLREIASGVGILANPSSKEWVGSRVGGDLIDLALLGVAFTRSEQRGRTLLATAAVLGVSVLDVLGTEQLAESRKIADPESDGEPGSPVLRSITIGRPRSEVYAQWRDVTQFPRFMENLESVEDLGDGRSRWQAKGPAGRTVEWEAEIVDEQPDERIAWRTVDGSQIYNCGSVRFKDAPRGEGTVVTVEMHYAPPGGKIAAAVLKLLRKEAGQQVGDDLRRLKQYMETGEVLLSDASRVPGPNPAQPVASDSENKSESESESESERRSS